MVIKKIVYVCLFIILGINPLYAYRAKGNTCLVNKKNKKNTESFSVLAFLKEKLGGPCERLRPSRSEKMHVKILV